MKNLKLNAIFFLLVRILNIAFPLITGPYIARTLSKENIGNYDTVNTITQFFIPLATFGIYTYGLRAISKVKNNKNNINKLFSELFYVSIISTFITTSIYVIYVESLDTSNIRYYLYYILGLQIISQFFAIEWVNEAFENYSFILYKTIFIRVLMLTLLFTMVKEENDIINYALVMSGVEILNILLSFIWIKRSIKLVRIQIKNLIQTFKNLVPLFLLANINMLFTYLDKLFLTKAPSSNYVADYVMASNIVMMILGVISGAISVNVPRLSYYVGQNQYDEYKNLVYKGSMVFSFFVAPISIGLIILGPSAAIIYGSEKFATAGIATSIFSARAIIYILEIILGTHILFVTGHEKIITLFVFIGGFINLILNTILYNLNLYNPEYYIGTTMLAEFIIIIFYINIIKRKNIIPLKIIFYNLFKYLVISSSFFIIFYIVSIFYPTNKFMNLDLIVNTLITVISSASIYIIINFILKDEILLEIFKSVKNTIKRLVG